MPTPDERARKKIDALLTAAGWTVQDFKQANLHAARGVAIREFQLNAGFGEADYLLYIDGKAAGVIEAKKEGAALTGVEVQSGKYAQGLPASLPAWRRPLPFIYESTGVETHFTNALDPEPRARNVFAFHQPDTLADWLARGSGVIPAQAGIQSAANEAPAPYELATFQARVRSMPELVTQWGEHKLWPAQIIAIRNLEKSLAANKPRALIQMATGSGKTFTAISFIYRLIKYAGARRVLFLLDRGNLGRQTKKGEAGIHERPVDVRAAERAGPPRPALGFRRSSPIKAAKVDQYVSPVNNFKFGEEYIVQHLSNNNLDKTACVRIDTIQRMYAMLNMRLEQLHNEMAVMRHT